MYLHRSWPTATLLLLVFVCGGKAAEVIPHAQDKPPGPALSPEEAIRRMTVPEGFSVELVAAEPDLVNPVAMTFDARGRVWITESLEYPRSDAGQGRDRIKIIEDTDGDGRADKFTIFAEGLNIPSGIAVGYGGVWVANAPDILLLRDTDGDDHADQREVVVTGFGRDDTHELPNSLTFGPDGWLYGLNGVFNASSVTQQGKRHDFTCALFRIHPRTREFQLFAEGTSNPWGVAWDGEGSAFVSACVIDHLWHLAERGYYIRQSGPYPPFTAPQGSIVRHKHQKAAYCGIHYFDSDAYPSQYRERLVMGNIHGGAINVDVLARDGSTYTGETAPDLLVANDAWFMPVVQKTGPDGCLYVLDWYDRYHCYQDARRDPEGIDRLKGRLYRIRYRDTPRAPQFDLTRESDDQLIERLASPNVYYRDLAQRLLAERLSASTSSKNTTTKLEQLAGNAAAPRKARMHALWALVGGGPLASEFHQQLLVDDDAGFRAWGVRAAGNQRDVDVAIRDRVVTLARDPSPDVRLQVVIAAPKLTGVDPLPLLVEVLSASGDDKLIPHVVWQILHPMLEEHSEQFLALVTAPEVRANSGVAAMMPRVIDRVLGSQRPQATLHLARMLSHELAGETALVQKCLAALTTRLENREITVDELGQLRPEIEPVVREILSRPANTPLHGSAQLLAAVWRDPQALAAVRATLLANDQPAPRRVQALQALVAARDESLADAMRTVFDPAAGHPVELRARALAALAPLSDNWVGEIVLARYSTLEPELRPRAIELLTERRAWAEQLLDAIGRGQIPAAVLNANQVRQLLVESDDALADKVRRHWGSLREDRDPRREEVIAQMRTFLRQSSGDAVAGQAIFKRVCGQCHKLHGEGQDVGPDITVNGRALFEQLLSNVFDPSLVIGASYQARTVVTADGRVLSGLVAEDGDQRLVLKIQGGKLETIPRRDVETVHVSRLSLMPEDLEKQLQPGELADLFALLTLDKPPGDPAARKLPGSNPVVPRETNVPAEYQSLVDEVAPGFAISKVAKSGPAIVAEHAARPGVLRTRPASAHEPLVLRRTVELTAGRRARLAIVVSAAADERWQLKVNAGGKTLHQQIVGGRSGEPAWETVSLDLSPLAGSAAKIEVEQRALDGKIVAAYWAQIEILSD